MLEKSEQNNIRTTILYFSIATLITWWFIAVSPVYDSLGQKLLSCAIASVKWSIQIVAAFWFLENKKWAFIKNISYTCLIGSLVLLPYSVSSSFGKYNGSDFFLGSLVISVATIVVSYLSSVRKSGIGKHWWAGWLFCLAIAIAAQLKVVFNVSLF
jgi:hypothetical protein